MSPDQACKPWFESDPDLFGKQEKILKHAGFQLDQSALEKEGRLRFRGFSKADPARELLVDFPQAFPSSAPKILSLPPSKLLARHHRIDTHQLCLFGFNETRWSATLSVADALAEAEALIAQFKDGGATFENEAPEPITRLVPYVPEAAILVPPPLSTFNGFAQLKHLTGHFRGKFIHEGDLKLETRGRGILLDATFGEKTISCSAPFSQYFGNQGKEFRGDWFFLPEQPTQEGLPDVFKKCFQQCKGYKKADFYWIGLIFAEETGSTAKTRLTWLIARANSQGKFHLIRTFPYIQGERYARVPGLEGLEQKRVAIVGCGSLGSKIASNLTASGVNHFRLIDYDYFEPNNSVRHELGVECFGLNKERALLTRLCSLNPAAAANSACVAFQVGGVNHFSGEQVFYTLIKDSDLIVDATGLHPVTHFLNTLAFELKIPLLVATVTNGAWSGEIVQVIPGKTPCWVCWLDQYFDNQPPSAPEPPGGIFAPGCEQPTFTGTTYDLGIVANLATSMCVQTLLPEHEDLDAANNYIRWSRKNKNGKPHFVIETLSTNAHKDCWCQAP
jgi:molybdopterin/thiamine biosynthesis adenylyltransferase